MKKTAYINVNILDGTKDMILKRNMTILVDDKGIITDIVPSSEIAKDYEIINLSGKYVLPGLINLHVHLAGDGKPKKKKQDPVKAVKLITGNGLMKKIGKKMCRNYALTELMSGVTTIRTVGGIADFDTQIRDNINANKYEGPRILASNMAVSVPEGHMVNSLAYCANTPDEAAAYVETIAKDKPDLIKLMITGGVLDARVKGEPGVLKMPLDTVKMACDKAHSLGLKVAAHVESPDGVRTALKGGVDTIEHGAKPDDEIINLFKANGSSLVTTISPALPFALFDQSVSHASDMEKFNGEIVMNGIIDCAKACLENDIPVGLGTDTACPYVTHYDMWRELYYFTRYCGVTNAFAIYTATLMNAKIAGIDNVTGSIEKGKYADFIVTDNNPLDNIKALRNLSMVVKDGRIVDTKKLKKFTETETELDKFI